MLFDFDNGCDSDVLLEVEDKCGDDLRDVEDASATKWRLGGLIAARVERREDGAWAAADRNADEAIIDNAIVFVCPELDITKRRYQTSPKMNSKGRKMAMVSVTMKPEWRPALLAAQVE